MQGDITPTADDLARDLVFDLVGLTDGWVFYDQGPMELAHAAAIRRALAAEAEIARLQKQIEGHAERIAAAHDVIQRNAEKSPLARLEAWRQANRAWAVEVRAISPGGGWHVRLFWAGFGQAGGREVHAFGDRHPRRAMLGPFAGEAYCQYDDGTDATLGECITAALELWARLYGEDASA